MTPRVGGAAIRPAKRGEEEARNRTKRGEEEPGEWFANASAGESSAVG
ncbi:MAG: hypothetical protein JOZ00_19010 [Mycobacterium sp.]|nr:hypothetical protein [Mycobacterium sp.]MBV8788762.1 hypothetical protein [Mycobacterium sp.]